MSNLVLMIVQINVPENEHQNESIYKLGRTSGILREALADKFGVERIVLVINETAEAIKGIYDQNAEQQRPTTSDTRTEQFLDPGL